MTPEETRRAVRRARWETNRFWVLIVASLVFALAMGYWSTR